MGPLRQPSLASAALAPSFLFRPRSLPEFLELTRQYKVAAHHIGQIIRGDVFRIEYNRRAVIDSSLESLRDAWPIRSNAR